MSTAVRACRRELRRMAAGRFRRVALLVVGAVAMLTGFVLIHAGASSILLETQRGADGYVMGGPVAYSTSSYAVVSDSYRPGSAAHWFIARGLLGTVRVRVHSSGRVLVGIASEAAANRYLSGVAREEAMRLDPGRSEFRTVAGGPPVAAPSASQIWVASAMGSGDHALTWPVRSGSWRIVLMNAAGTPNVAAEIRVGASLPHVLAIGVVLLGAGVLTLLLGVGAMYASARIRPADMTATAGEGLVPTEG
jgi:hypothetical protein